MEIKAIKKPGTTPGKAKFRTEPPVTDEIVKELHVQVSGHPSLGKKWSNEDGYLCGDVSHFGIPDRQFIEILSSVLGIAARTVERRHKEHDDKITEYLTGLSGNTGLPLED